MSPNWFERDVGWHVARVGHLYFFTVTFQCVWCGDGELKCTCSQTRGEGWLRMAPSVWGLFADFQGATESSRI